MIAHPRNLDLGGKSPTCWQYWDWLQPSCNYYPGLDGLVFYTAACLAASARISNCTVRFRLLQWSQNTLGVNWSDRAHLMEGHQMVVSGPYQWVPHPICSSFLLIRGSPFLISANWFIRGTWIMMMALDISVHIKIEEQLIITRCGDQYLE
jgi:protein-S-isoprenylcysteine O-methyltransferase Ste14